MFYETMKRLYACGHTVTILTTKFRQDLASYEVHEGIHIYRIGNNRYDFMWKCLFWGISLAKKADIIHTTTYNACIPAWIIGKITKKKVVVTVHEVWGKLWYTLQGWKGIFFLLFERLIFFFPFDAYICVSVYTNNILRVYCWIPDSKLVTIYNGINRDFWDAKKVNTKDVEAIRKEFSLHDTFVCLYFWRPGISKGIPYLMQAIHVLRTRMDRFVCILISPESKNAPTSLIETYIEKYNLSSSVRLLKHIDSETLRTFLCVADVVVLPSLTEGFWFSIAETCALGRPLITTRIGAIPEVAFWKVHFVRPASFEDIVKKIMDFCNGRYTEIPKKHFSWEENVSQVLEVYHALCK